MLIEKPWYASKGVWGGIIAAAAGVVALFGAPGWVEDLLGDEQLPEQLAAVGAAIGGLLAIIGRVMAKSRVTATKGSMLLLLLLLPAAIATPGCMTASPSERYRNAVNAYDLAATAVVAAEDAGLLSEADKQAIRRADTEAYHLLVEMRQALEAGEPDSLDAHLEELRRLLAILHRLADPES